MAEDWRVTVTLPDEERASALVASLRGFEAQHAVGGRVAVSGAGRRVFLYADKEADAHEAERVVRGAPGGAEADVALDRWHPLEERWEDAAVPLPQTEAERQSEHERLEAEETAEAAASGLAAWEVRVELDSHRQAEELADRLEAEGWPVLRRWRYLLVGCSNEDEARTLAARLGDEVPDGASIEVEAAGVQSWQALAPNPFAFFGGLGG